MWPSCSSPGFIIVSAICLFQGQQDNQAIKAEVGQQRQAFYLSLDIFFCHHFDAAIRMETAVPHKCAVALKLWQQFLQSWNLSFTGGHAPGPYMTSINQDFFFCSLSHLHLESSIIYLTKYNLHYTIQNLLIMLRSEVCIALILASL